MEKDKEKRYQGAEEVLEDYLNDVSDNASIRRYLAGNYVIRRKFDLALVEGNKAFSLSPAHYNNFLMKGHIYSSKGDLVRAEKEYLKVLGIPEVIDARKRLATLLTSK